MFALRASGTREGAFKWDTEFLMSSEVGSLLETGARKIMQSKRMAVSCTYPKGTGTILSFRAAWYEVSPSASS